MLPTPTPPRAAATRPYSGSGNSRCSQLSWGSTLGGSPPSIFKSGRPLVPAAGFVPPIIRGFTFVTVHQAVTGLFGSVVGWDNTPDRPVRYIIKPSTRPPLSVGPLRQFLSLSYLRPYLHRKLPAGSWRPRRRRIAGRHCFWTTRLVISPGC